MRSAPTGRAADDGRVRTGADDGVVLPVREPVVVRGRRVDLDGGRPGDHVRQSRLRRDAECPGPQERSLPALSRSPACQSPAPGQGDPMNVAATDLWQDEEHVRYPAGEVHWWLPGRNSTV